MPHRYLIKDIALQAGLSTATVDRVLHGRIHVRAQTRTRVEVAIAELERQEHVLAMGGKSHVIDVVMEAADRFSKEVRTAFEAEAAHLHPMAFRPRFHLAEKIGAAKFAAQLDRIRLRGSDGVIVKGPDLAIVRQAVDRLVAAQIPVITFVTDLSGTGRHAYAGIDNQAAGNTAAWLILKTMGAQGKILATLSSENFRGEEERYAAFVEAIAKAGCGDRIVRVSEGYGRDEPTGQLVGQALVRQADIQAVYSAGGANRAVVKAFSDIGRQCRVFVAHDLDTDNRELLASGQIDFVINHDLKADVRAIYALLAKGVKQSAAPAKLHSAITVHTPLNPA